MRLPLSAAHWTVVLSGTLAAAAVTLSVTAPGRPLLASHLPVALLVAMIATTFLLAEQFLMSVEFRRQTHAATLAGVPLLLGALLLAPLAFVLARVVGSLIAFARQGCSADKILYNTSAYAFEAALDVTLLHRLVGTGNPPTGWTAVAVVGVLALVDQLMSLLVLLLIRMHNGPLTRKDALEVLTPAAVLSVVASTFAFATLILIRDGAFGVGLAVVLAAIGILAYREHASTRRRHQSLALVHELVTGGVGAETVDALATQLLSQIRHLLRAASAELLLVDGGAPARTSTHGTPSLTQIAAAQIAPAQVAAAQVAAAHVAAAHVAPAQVAPAQVAPVQVRTGIHETRATAEISATSVLVLAVDEHDQLSVTHRDLDPSDWSISPTLSRREPMLATRNTKDPGLRRWLAEHARRDAMLVALPESSGLRGSLTVTDRLGETATFGADDLILLETLTGHLAVAVHSTRLLEKLGYEATHDSLTGLANRAQLYERIAAVLAQPAAQAAVLLLDLDRFKEVNDALGHDVGDRLLVIIADRLRSSLPPEATIARLGGDEFAILLPDLPDGLHSVPALAERLGAYLAQPVSLDEALLTPEASIGVAATTATSPQTDLLRHADTAMYHSKTHNVRVTIYHPDMDRGRVERLALLADLRTSLTHHPEQFVLHYQPKIDLHSGAVTSVEALARWHHPTLGVIAPDRFIPLAESAGLITALTPFILTAALLQCRTWLPRHDISVAVNLSAREISDPGLPHRVAQALAATGVPAHSLILEITESSVMGDPAQTLPVLTQLNQLGIGLSLDDFGTGHSSLSYLQQLPVHEIKIDRSFILGLGTHDRANSRALIRSIAGLGTNLGLRIVAEGIEDADTLEELRELGCDIGQGYHISRPLTAVDLRTWLADHHTTKPSRLLPVTAAPTASNVHPIPIDRPGTTTRPPRLPQPLAVSGERRAVHPRHGIL